MADISGLVREAGQFTGTFTSDTGVTNVFAPTGNTDITNNFLGGTVDFTGATVNGLDLSGLTNVTIGGDLTIEGDLTIDPDDGHFMGNIEGDVINSDGDTIVDTENAIFNGTSLSVDNVNGDDVDEPETLKFWTGTQAEYDALTKAADTIYFIKA